VLGACVSPLERGEQFYRQGDVRGAIELWRTVEESHRDYEQIRERLNVVEEQFDRTLKRYEKRALFFESEGQLAEAVLYYRLALKMDPDRAHLLERTQRLVRELAREEAKERAALEAALDSGDLDGASVHAAALARLNPFDPALQLEVRQVRAGIGEQVLRHLEEGRRHYAAGDREKARRAFLTVLALDPRNQSALGYLSYIKQFEALEAEQKIPPAPASISRKEILAEGHYRSARTAEDSGELFWALSEYSAALSLNESHEDARRRLETLRARLKPQVPELYELGKRYFQDEDLHNALRAWRRVLLIEPGNQRTRENVERAERILTRLEEIQTSGS
jgi:tetratricopeptide (TPR) repeat protein